MSNFDLMAMSSRWSVPEPDWRTGLLWTDLGFHLDVSAIMSIAFLGFFVGVLTEKECPTFLPVTNPVIESHMFFVSSIIVFKFNYKKDQV